jgi:hypothetical protein
MRAISLNVNTGKPLSYSTSTGGHQLAKSGLYNDYIVLGLINYHFEALDIHTMTTRWGMSYTELSQSNMKFGI